MFNIPMFNISRRPTSVAVVACLLLSPVLAACGSGSGSSSSDKSIKVWIEEDLPERVAATQKIVDTFEAKSGVKVKLVPVAEDQFNQLLTSSAAAGDLPDVIGGVPLGQVRTMSANKLIDDDATAAVMKSLDTSTFSDSALTLTKDGDTQLSIPSEAWTQLLVYRKDLFDKAGLAAPTTYDAITAAAKKLDSPKMAGFIGATIAGDAFTEQTFEYLGLANGCELVDDAGKVTFDSDQCVQSLAFYQDLVRNYSVPGGQDVDTTRAAYFSGKAAMTIWSTFLLDEMAGLRKDALPNCSECASDPAFLAKNSGIVTSLQGSSGTEPKVYGEITSWVLPKGAASPAKDFVTYMMNDGYQPWIAIAPEGKVPVRTGSGGDPAKFTKVWSSLPVGVDTKAPLSKFYDQSVIDALLKGPSQLSRWAIPEGQGDLLGAIQGEQPVAKAVNDVSNGTDPKKAAAAAADAMQSIQDSLN